MKTLKFILTCLTSLTCLTAWADLQVTIRPGYTFGPLERAENSKLNRLGNPTATITGTIGGTNAALAAGSVTSEMMNDAVVDGSNIVWHAGAAARMLGIAPGGVGVTQSSSNLAGLGLSGGSGTALRVNVDTNRVMITNDVLTLATNSLTASHFQITSNHIIVGSTGNVVRLAPFPTGWSYDGTNLTANGAVFTSYQYAMAVGEIANTNHSLGATPSSVQWVLVCTTAELGYAVGDEISVHSALGTASDFTFSAGRNSTNVFLIGRTPATGISVIRKDNGQSTEITGNSHWRVKCYARP